MMHATPCKIINRLRPRSLTWIFSCKTKNQFQFRGRAYKCPIGSPESKLKQKFFGNFGADLFGKYLIVTNTLSMGLLMSLSDFLLQEIDLFRKKKYTEGLDWGRIKNMGTVGLLQGCFAHFFYQFLDSKITGSDMYSVAKKVFIDQTLGSTVCIFLFFLGINYLTTKRLDDAWKELKEKFVLVYIGDCSLWIPAQIINFYLLPARYRVVYINFVAICYNMFLSFMKHSDSMN